ncbi:type A2 lantipeptide [Streptomyces hypolithicus]
MNFSQVATQEISDNDLDHVSGGILGGNNGNVAVSTGDIAPVSSAVNAVTGTVEAATGLNAGAVTGLVAGL